MYCPAVNIMLFFHLRDHFPQDRLFWFISGVHFHTDRDKVAVQKEAEPDDWILPVFLAGAFHTEAILPVDLKEKVGAVKVCFVSGDAVDCIGLWREEFDNLFIVCPQKGKAVKELVIRIIAGMEEAGEDFMECPEFAAGVYTPGIDQGWEKFIRNCR